MSPACLQTALEGPHARRVAGGSATVVTAVVACVAAVAAAQMAWPVPGRRQAGEGRRLAGIRPDPGLCEPVHYSGTTWPAPGRRQAVEGRRLARIRPAPGLRLATVYRL